MGSDYKKPDATTLISRNNYKELLWPLPVENMLFAGRATAEKLRLFGIHTIGELALTPQKVLEKYFGKAGVQLHAKAKAWCERLGNAYQHVTFKGWCQYI